MSGGNVDRGIPYNELQEAEGLAEQQWWAIYDYLKAEGLLREGSHIEITERGIDEIERSQRSPQLPTEHFSGTVIQNYYGSVGAVQSGSHSTAIVTQQRNSHPELLSLIEQLKRTLETLSESPERNDALEQSDMLMEEAQLEHPRPKRIKSYLSAIIILTQAESVQMLSAEITKLIENLPEPV
jgi:hypothetical protein